LKVDVYAHNKDILDCNPQIRLLPVHLWWTDQLFSKLNHPKDKEFIFT